MNDKNERVTLWVSAILLLLGILVSSFIVHRDSSYGVFVGEKTLTPVSFTIDQRMNLTVLVYANCDEFQLTLTRLTENIEPKSIEALEKNEQVEYCRVITDPLEAGRWRIASAPNHYVLVTKQNNERRYYSPYLYGKLRALCVMLLILLGVWASIRKLRTGRQSILEHSDESR